MSVIYGFDPVWRSDARILVLGTMPSVASLERGFYYAHPQNAFWRIVADVLGVDKPSGADDKKRMLIEGGIALWDVARSCLREGSLDSNIKDARPNAINEIIAGCPDMRRILFNGKKAQELYLKFFDRLEGVEYMALPSTSPAYTLSYDKKLAAWRMAITLEEYNERR